MRFAWVLFVLNFTAPVYPGSRFRLAREGAECDVILKQVVKHLPDVGTKVGH